MDFVVETTNLELVRILNICYVGIDEYNILSNNNSDVIASVW